MKQIFIIIVVIAAAVTVSGQTPADIAQKWKEIRESCKKYDNGADSAYQILQEQINATQREPVANAIWHSCLAQFLDDYYMYNSYRIGLRTQVDGELTSDWKEWDARTFKQRVREEYLLSLKNADLLMSVPADEVKELIFVLDGNSKTLQVKTLYQVLAYRVLNYFVYEANNSHYPKEEEKEVVLSKTDLWDNDQFVKFGIANPSSDRDIALSQYRELTIFFQEHHDEMELIMLTLERFDFMRNQGLVPDNSLEWYISYLEQWAQQCEQMKGYGLIACKIGNLYISQYDQSRGRSEEELENAPKKDYLVKAEYWLKKAINASGKSFYEDGVRKAIRGIHTRTLKLSLISGKKAVAPTKSPTLWEVKYVNSSQLYICVVPASVASFHMTQDQTIAYIKEQSPVYEEVVKLVDKEDFEEHNGYYMLPELPAGAYWLVASDQPDTDWDAYTPREFKFFQISDIDVYPRGSEEGLEVLVVNRQTGAPLQNATVEMTEGKKKYTLTTDDRGFCLLELDKKVSYYLRIKDLTVSWQGQSLIPSWSVGCDKDQFKEPKERMVGHLFTDRTLYRPGQTVFLKGIVEQRLPDETNRILEPRMLMNYPVHIILKDANYQLIEEIDVTTNEFGSFSCEFKLPKAGRTGSWLIEAYIDKYACSRYISVEEYKRPAFEVNVKTPEEPFSIGQEVTVEGDVVALAGYPISGASVDYSVTRRTSFPWWCRRWRPSSESETVARGKLETDENGKFRVTFPTEEDETLYRYLPLYCYEVSVNVTDINGETHTGNTSVYVSKRNLLLTCELPEEINLEKSDNQYRILLTNTVEKPQNGTVQYEIFSLQVPDQYMRSISKADVTITNAQMLNQNFPEYTQNGENLPENWPATSIWKGSVLMTKEKPGYFSFPDLASLRDGCYKVVLSILDKSGDRIESEYYVHCYHESAQQCSAYQALWAVVDDKVNVGDNLKVKVGTMLPEAHVFCEIYAHNEKVSTQWLTLHGNMQTIDYKVEKRDLGNIIVHLVSVHSNVKEDKSYSVTVVDSMRDIHFEFLRFRDKTQPGSQEEYQIRLVDRQGKPVSAELLCSMYDFALDALGSRNNHVLSFYTHSTYADGAFRTVSWENNYSQYNYRNVYGSSLPKFSQNWLTFNPLNRSSGKMYTVLGNRSDGDATTLDGVRIRDVSFSADYPENEVQEVMVFYDEYDEVPVMSFAEEEVAPRATPRAKRPARETKPAEYVRTNFNETAFFYPQLRTDEHGDVFVSFTMPDALTKWKMQGLAHNTDLQYGRFEKFVQTRKELMIVPNAPRFLREGDTMDFSAKVVSVSDKRLRGYVTLEFLNAVNNQPVQMMVDGGRDGARPVSTTGHMQYDIEPGSSQEVHFRIVVPEDVPAVTYRIIAHNTIPEEVAGDGEEKTLPVLTNRMMVTESMPFYISGKGSKTFTFDKLQNSFGATDGRDGARPVSTTLKHYSLTLECTPNPVWYAIQAMPYMMEYPHDCNEQMFSRYYANALATHILKANPVIEEVFNRWQTESPEAFCSALEKNSELKQIMLEETPWVLDAQREGTNKQALASMFDFKRMSKEESATLKKLQQAQNGDGGWPWFAGGKSSDFITRHIVAGFGHLKALGVSTDVANRTLRNAVSYMDEQMYQRYLDRKKYHYTYVDETHYLYARSFYYDKLSKQHQAAYDTAYNVLLSEWKSESFYTQAMIALTAWRNGDQKVAKEIVAYLKSMAQHDEEMGMFWKKQGGGWFWYEQPVERQAMLIEAFHTITPEDAESLAQMQLWLLKQKQTQHWGTTKSTTEAIYALLLNKKLVAEDKTVAVTVGNVRLPDESSQTEAGTGYFKKAWTSEEITADKANVRIEKGTDGPAWGGLYWQYFENLDKITRSDDKNLVIEKAIYKVENTDKGEVLKAITAEQPLQKGDKVRVRVVITADRDMEFVHLKDMRAATFEPVNVFSQYKYQDGLWYYEATKDAATHFFIDWMPKGKYVFEYTLFATQSGNFSNGITEIECMYAPEFRSHSAGVRVKVQ